MFGQPFGIPRANNFGGQGFFGAPQANFGNPGLNFFQQQPTFVKPIDPSVLKARKRLDISRSQLSLLSTKNSHLPKATTKKILSKVLKRNTGVLLPIDSSFYPYGKSLAPLIKSIKVLPKERTSFTDPVFSKKGLERVLKMIKACTRLRYLDILRIPDLKSSFIKPLRRLSALECLVVELGVKVIKEKSPFCIFLNQLRRIHLKIDLSVEEEMEFEDLLEGHQGNDVLGLASGFSKISSEIRSSLKNLKHFELEFRASRIPAGKSWIETLLTSVDPTKTHKFYFTFYINNFALDVQKSLRILQKVDHLGFFADRIFGLNDSFNANSKIFFFISDECQINDADIIKNCSSLRKLSARTSMLSSIQDDQTKSLDIPSTLESFNLMVENCDDNLLEKEIEAWLLALPNLPVLNTFNLTIWPWGAKSYQKLHVLHQHNSLKNLQSYQLTITDYDRYKLSRDMLEDVSGLLKYIGDVPELGFRFKRATDTLNNSAFWNALEENKNLKVLFFSLPEGRNVYKLEFPYQKLVSLEELEKLSMEIPPPLNREEIVGKLPKVPKLKLLYVKSSEPKFLDDEFYVSKFA